MAARAWDLVEENEREKGAQESAAKTAKEKLKAAESAEKKAAVAEKNRALAEKRCADLLEKQNETEVKLAEAISLNTSNAEEIADLRAGLAAAEQKWYDVGFALMPKIPQSRWWLGLGIWALRPGGLPLSKQWELSKIRI